MDQNNRNSNRNSNRKVVRIRIEILSDTMCPWCQVGKHHLEQALRAWQNGNDNGNSKATIEADVRWWPYFPDRTLSDQGTPTHDYYQHKYGDGATGERTKAALLAAGRRVDLDFTPSCRITHFYPTIRSHCLIAWVGERYGYHKQNDVVEAIFRLFCQEGKALNDLEALVEAARKVGCLQDSREEEDLRNYLQDPHHQATVFALADSLQHLAPHGVPTFLFSWQNDDNKVQYTLSGAQSPEAFRRVLEQFQQSS